MASLSPAEALAKIQDLQRGQDVESSTLAILRISEPITSSLDVDGIPRSPSKRASDASIVSDDNPTPASLEADLTHYKELFSKLRFSYLEQVTKEKFLRGIVGDPPLVVGHNENVELEATLAEAKQQLQQRKEEVRVMVEEMEKTGRELARRYKNVQIETTKLSELPQEIAQLEQTIASLKQSQAAYAAASDPHNTSSSQNLSLPATLKLLAEREAELAAIDRQMASLQNTLPRKTREAEAMERELGVLERRKSEAIGQAREAERKKLEGESDGLEEMGRWYRGAEATLKKLVDVEN
ncbi:Kinetochore protein Sos7 [Talaromyces pinophilus]|nr:Kinetochore protein Sos7 [Talaromyces pinophilus]